jgi:hypothetical protein
MLKKINIDLEENDKDTLMAACKRRGVSLHGVFLALFDQWLSEDDAKALEVVYDYRKRQTLRQIEALKKGAVSITHDVIGEVVK